MVCCVISAGDDWGEPYRQWEDHPNRKDWVVLADLGRGAFSAVVAARNIHTQQIAALKIIFLDNPDVDSEMEQLLTREGQLLVEFKHPNIVTCNEVLKGPRSHVLVMEVLTGGLVFDKLHGLSNIFSEKDVAAVFIQVAEAVQYIHRKGIIHRDIKPENVVFATPPAPDEPTPIVKLIDLGMAAEYNPLKPLTGCCGTAGFVAPEIIRGGVHSPAMDVYSLGVLLFIMLVGRKPFNFNEVEKLSYGYKKLQEAPGLQDPRWLDLSPDAKDLIIGMLATTPERRLSMKQVLQHEWVLSKGGLVIRPLGHDVALGAATVAALRRLKNLGVGTIALPAVMKASAVSSSGASTSRSGVLQDTSTSKRMTAEHKAFLNAVNQLKKQNGSVKGNGAISSLAHKITAKSYQQMHDYSVRSSTRGGHVVSHPLTQLERSVRSGNVFNDSSLHGGPPRYPTISSADASMQGGMRKVSTSLLLSDLLPSTANSSLHGGDGMPRSSSVQGLNNLAGGFEMLRSSILQYWEVREATVHGGRKVYSGQSSANSTVHSVLRQQQHQQEQASSYSSSTLDNNIKSNLALGVPILASDLVLGNKAVVNKTVEPLPDGSGGHYRVVRRSLDGTSDSSHGHDRSYGSFKSDEKRRVNALKALND